MAKRLNNPDFKSIEFEVIKYEEFSNWKSQIVMSNEDRMGLRRPPYAFTEQGVGFAFSMMDIGAIEMLARLEGMK